MERKSFNGNVQFAWDGTSLELAQTCQRKYYYRMIRNIVPKNASVHLIFGGIYASALEHFYIHRANGASIQEALRLVVRKAMLDSWVHDLDTEGNPIPGTGRAVVFESAAKTRDNLVRSIVWYVDQFGDESQSAIKTYHLASGKPAVELSFAVELTEDIMYCGHLDRVVDFNDGLYWMDQKTTGDTISPRFFDSFKPNNQFLGYTWAGQIVLQTPVRGGIIDGAQIAVGFTRYERAPITYTKPQLEEWHDNTIDTIRLTQRSAEKDKWSMNLSACGNYGGCPYRVLCARSPSVREAFIEGDFVHPESTWDPLTPR